MRLRGSSTQRRRWSTPCWRSRSMRCWHTARRHRQCRCVCRCCCGGCSNHCRRWSTPCWRSTCMRYWRTAQRHRQCRHVCRCCYGGCSIQSPPLYRPRRLTLSCCNKQLCTSRRRTCCCCKHIDECCCWDCNVHCRPSHSPSNWCGTGLQGRKWLGSGCAGGGDAACGRAACGDAACGRAACGDAASGDANKAYDGRCRRHLEVAMRAPLLPVPDWRRLHPSWLPRWSPPPDHAQPSRGRPRDPQ